MSTHTWSNDALFAPRVSSTEFSTKERLLAGVWWGALAGFLYALAAGVIDVVLLREVPLRVDWPVVGLSLVTNTLGCAVIGGVTGASANAWKGIGYGALTMGVFYLLRSLWQPHLNYASFFLIMISVGLPLLVMLLPVVGGLRYALHRHELSLAQPEARRRLALAQLVIGVAGLAIFAGTWAQLPVEAQKSLRRVHELISTTVAQSANEPLPAALRDVPSFRERASRNYQLTQEKSSSLVDGLEVHIYFETGLVVTCKVDNISHAMTCAEDKRPTLGQPN